VPAGGSVEVQVTKTSLLLFAVIDALKSYDVPDAKKKLLWATE
jgi:hypothetical protein